VVSQSWVEVISPKAFVALHRVVLLALFHDVREELAGGQLLDRLAQIAGGAAAALAFSLGFGATGFGRLGILSFGLTTAAVLVAYSMRNGGSKKLLDEHVLRHHLLELGAEAKAQSTQRFAPCASVKQMDQVWCSSSSTGSPTI